MTSRGMTGDPICGNCCTETPTLAPCPCGLGERCSVVGGVCPRCYRIVLANCIDRKKELRT